MSRRVVLTGAGTVNALAHDVPGTLAALVQGRSGIGPLDFRDVERLTIRIGAQVRGWPGLPGMTPREAALWDPFTRYALAAADEAVAMAGLGPRELALAGVILGTAAGGIATWEDNYRAVFAEGRGSVGTVGKSRSDSEKQADRYGSCDSSEGAICAAISPWLSGACAAQ